MTNPNKVISVIRDTEDTAKDAATHVKDQMSRCGWDHNWISARGIRLMLHSEWSHLSYKDVLDELNKIV